MLQTVLLHPKSRGSVRLNGTDLKTPPIVDFNYFDDRSDLEILAKGKVFQGCFPKFLQFSPFSPVPPHPKPNNQNCPGTKFAFELLSSEHFAKIGVLPDTTAFDSCKEKKLTPDDYWNCVVAVSLAAMRHPVGTCAMGAQNRPHTVVDNELK